MPARNLVIVLLTAIVALACNQKVQRYRYANTITEAVTTIEQRYVEPVDPRRLFEDAMSGMVQRLDPYSSYISADRYQQFQESLNQEFGGIGIMVEGPPRVPRMTVATPLVGTPAYRAGMVAGDIILEIDGQSTEGMSLEDAVKLMRGEKGSPVNLLVQHPGSEETQAMTILRDTIPVESVLGDRRRPDGSWEYVLEDEPSIGYIRITTFGERTVSELRDVLQAADPAIKAWILDMRGNAGGLLHSAVETCDLFIDEGTIVSTRGRGGRIQQEFFATTDMAIDPSTPVVVLSDRFSASAAEIVAACLQDHNRAVVVGERSFGKGTVQNILELDRGRSALKLTTARYWRPSGQNIHRVEGASEDDEWGVRPNEGMEVKLEEEEYTQVRIQRRERDLMSGAEQSTTVEPDAQDSSDNDKSPPENERTTTDPESSQPNSEGANSEDMNSKDVVTETENAEAGGNEDASSETATQPIEDRQLQRAIQYLHERIGGDVDRQAA
ncbi:MAG: S41 family peptidase [Pirellulaceae bacterium]